MVTRHGGQTLQQLDQKDCAVSILGNIQSLSRQGTEPPALFDPTLSTGIGLADLQRSFPNSVL